ncbi:hypothetical protein ACLQ2R_28060 [Streptosporangium sp. DT93]|uniref:hypothetical protein n=1 Tax=Streptosporangium sp. DT93 TaxID=3393428 RepID=UPI003CF98E69
MNVGNTVPAGSIVMLVLVAVFIVAGLTVSLIAITLTSIKENDGRTPEWPVSWPKTPVAMSGQRIALSAGRTAALPSGSSGFSGSSGSGHPGWRVSMPHRSGDSPRRAHSSRWAEASQRRVSPPQRADAPAQRVNVPRQRVNPWG